MNIHGKTLVCYVLSFLAAYIILAYLQIEVHGDVLGPMCYQIGNCDAFSKISIEHLNNRPIIIRFQFFISFSIHSFKAPVLLFCLIAQFCWQTVMCADIWLTFGWVKTTFSIKAKYLEFHSQAFNSIFFSNLHLMTNKLHPQWMISAGHWPDWFWSIYGSAMFIIIFSLKKLFLFFPFFSTLQSVHTLRQNKRDNRKFLYYSAYAWGFPLAWTMFTVYASEYKPFSDGWNPTYGVASCFFSSQYRPTAWQSFHISGSSGTNLSFFHLISGSVQKKEHFLYFLLPSGLHVSINCVLFVMTAIYCTRVKGEIHRMQANIDETSTSTKRRKFITSKAMFV